MCIKGHRALLALVLALVNVLCVLSQTPPPQPRQQSWRRAQIVVQTSPNAEVYLDDVRKGQASSKGRLVIEPAPLGNHVLRVSLAGKQTYEQTIKVTAGVNNLTVVLADAAGTVLVQTSPGAEVFLDNASRGVADAMGRLSVPDVAAGAHELRIAAAGKQEYKQNVTVLEGQETVAGAPLADLAGSVVVQTSPGAEVFLDDSRRGVTDGSGKLAVDAVAAGAHDLRITAPGKKEYHQKISVTAGQELKFEAQLEDAGPPPPGTVRENPKDGLKYVWIPAGSFLMGCSPGDKECAGDEKPPHQVTLTKGFWLGQTEVTVGAYKRFAAATDRQMPPAPGFNSGWAKEQMPMVTVTWDEAFDYCSWAGGRLPTEAEWEYAARGGKTAARYGPIDEIAWYEANSESQTHPVGQKRANAFHLYDMLGNTLEWVNDWFEAKDYRSDPAQDPAGPARGTKRVYRGGNFILKAKSVRVSERSGGAPGERLAGAGVRCGVDAFAP
jgi:formylglycine-generating enzyme required for sulfatase activity